MDIENNFEDVLYAILGAVEGGDRLTAKEIILHALIGNDQTIKYMGYAQLGEGVFLETL